MKGAEPAIDPQSQRKGFVDGFFLPLEAVGVLLKNRGLKRYAIFPLVFSALAYGLVIALFIWLLTLWGVEVGPWEFWGPVGGWLSTAINWSFVALKWVVGLPVLLLACYFTFTTVGMVIASPFNDMLSERVERAMCVPVAEPTRGWWRTMRLIGLSMWDSLVIVLRQLGWTVAALPLLLIPGFGFLPLFFVGAYFAGLGFVDISPARHYLRNYHKRPMYARDRWAILGLGVALQFLFLIPFLGLVLLPVGVTAGTMLYCRGDWGTLFQGAALPPPPGYEPPTLKTIERMEA